MSTQFRPDGDVTLNKTINQLGILVLDGSGSMENPATGNVTIAKAVEGALIEMFNRFNVSKKKQNFSFACIKFDNTVSVTLEPSAFDFNLLMNSSVLVIIRTHHNFETSKFMHHSKQKIKYVNYSND